ncbi:hypothetical protein F7725_021773 [Dissostichus mawsoni]|uniref:SAM domain-containing protein n=1 Tax=Dissostichus mawsoni TaxID=36200 RepID=A0A7J5ZC65_DISMA|nr:hypothetical protein F7725_021773 [Dissostichus mawsoni]
MQSQEQPLALTAVTSLYSTNGKEEEVNTDAESMEEEVEFNWEEYMEETGANAAPHTTFKHVEVSLQSSFQPGMKLEVANKSSPDSYWVATIITTCGQLLLLRFSGYGDDRKADFWCDVMTAELHPVGWCTQNNKTLMPPEAIREKYSDWTEFLVQDLTGSRTAPANLEGPLRGKNTVDLIVEGSVLELQDYWPVRVLQNVGGGWRLRYSGLSEDHRAQDSWLFYLDVRLRPLGWALENQLALEPPAGLRSLKSASDWQEALQEAQLDGQKSPLPLEVFKDHADPPKHSFRMGMKLEMVSPWEQLQICPVSVTKVYNDFYFQVTLDDLSPDAKPRFVVCHAHSPGILPVQWCLKHGVTLERPPGFRGHDFDWADYLKQSGTEAATDACFPDVWRSPCQSVSWMWSPWTSFLSAVRGQLLHSDPSFQTCLSEAEEDSGGPARKQLAPSPQLEPTPVISCQPVAMDLGSANGRYCCSKIFVNHRCFSGPYLNKGRIAELPQAVGPGKCTLVLKEPGRVLKELQDLEDQSWDCQEETLKANCSAARTSSAPSSSPTTYYYGKKRKLSKPMAGEEATEAKPTRRRKKRKAIFVQKKRRSSNVDYTAAGSPQDSEEDEELTLQSGSEGTSSEPQPAPPRRLAAQGLQHRGSCGGTEAPEGRRRSTRSLSTYNQNKYQPPEGQDMQMDEEEDQLVLDRNPLEWSVDEVVQFINSTDCASLTNIFQEQDIDGQALLLLTLPTVQECMDLKLGPAIKLCHQIERVKVAFYRQFAN